MLEVYTTRPDTLFGATYMVVAPEHPMLEAIVSSENRNGVDEYVKLAASKSDFERTELQKTKTGVFTGIKRAHEDLHKTCASAWYPVAYKSPYFPAAFYLHCIYFLGSSPNYKFLIYMQSLLKGRNAHIYMS